MNDHLTQPGLPGPLSRLSLVDATPLSATIKTRAEDFLVDEVPLFDLSGEGEHLYVGVQKKGLSHQEMIGRLARHFNVPAASIGAAGMKDRNAVTLQTVSLHLCSRQPPAVDPGWNDMGFVWMRRHNHRLRRGQLRGNRFSIRLRDIDPLKTPTVWSRLKSVAARGLPNAFGPQRFGIRGDNHLLGWCLLHGYSQAFLDIMLRPNAVQTSPAQEESRDLYTKAKFKEAAQLLHSRDGNEKRILLALAEGRPPALAIRAAGPVALEYFVTSLQSAIFNRVLDSRIAASTIDCAVEGDVLWRPGAHGRFLLTPEIVADAVQMAGIQERVRVGELGPSGPLFGSEMFEPQGAAKVMEDAAMSDFHMDGLCWRTSQFLPLGARRPLSVWVRDPHTEAGFDDLGPYIRVAFDLPAGSFATSLLHEVLGEAPRDGSR